MSTRTNFSRLGSELPPIGAPFAVFLDADDREWSEQSSRAYWAKKLLDAGCRYFVCFGGMSEKLHDDIDSVLMVGEYQSVVTTFHDDESPEEVVDFFKMFAEPDMVESLVLVENIGRWTEFFEVTGEIDH